MVLIIPTEGPCANPPHRCDMCRICKAGRCCRRDNPDRVLPAEGSWPGSMYGELGILEHDPADEKVRCHVCGDWYTALGRHIFWAHDLDGAEYRATFGLRQRTALAGKRYCDTIRVRNKDLLPRIRPEKNPIANMTPEQHSALSTGHTLPMETKRNPRYQEGRRKVGALTSAKARRSLCKCGCGELLSPGHGEHRGQRYIRGHVPPTLADRVEHALREAGGQLMSCREMLDVFPGEEESQVRRALVTLVRQGRVVRPGRGLYAPAEKKE